MNLRKNLSEKQSELLNAALALARLGYRVFPCVPGNKHPAVRSGFHAATRAPDQIRQWWRKWPQANVGVPCQGVVVIDVDPGGEAWLTPERRASIRATGCPVARTPRGGRHFWFRTPPGKQWRCSTGKLPPHVDVRAAGGYVVAPPSKTTAGQYRWLCPLVPPDQLPLPPGWLVTALDQLHAGHAEANGRPAPRGEVLAEGQRNSGLTRVGGKLRRAGFDEADLAAFLLAYNASRCVPPLPEDEVRAIAKSVARYPAGGEQDARLVVARGDELKPEPVLWLWPGRVPRGEATIIAGAPDVGKSTLSMDLAARVSRGAEWPDGAGHAPQGSAIVLSAEDSPERTLLPRFLAAGGDPRRVHFVQAVADSADGERFFNIAWDVDALREKIEELGDVVLLIVDPVDAYLPPKADSHKNADIRRALAPMDRLAKETGVAVVYISHWRKAVADSAIYRVNGSIGFVAAARAAWAVGKAPDNEDGLRVLARIKCNLATDDVPNLGFALEPSSVPGQPDLGTVPRVRWQGPVDVDAEDLAGPRRQGERGPEPEALHNAMDFLGGMLAHGPVPQREIEARAKGRGISSRTLERAKKSLGVKAVKQGGAWHWKLPEPDPWR